MTCPDCERYRISASMWRNKAYELRGAPLPWNAEELIEEAVLAEREACAELVVDLDGGLEWVAKEIRARNNQ